MVLVRRVDVEATALQRQGELGLWAPLVGQEAAQIGAGHALGTHDFVFPSYREHGLAWTRGVDPLEVLSLFRGTTHGGWDPKDHGFGLYTIVIGNQALHACGWAFGEKALGGDGVAVTCFGDGATSQGDINEAFVWASVFDLPVVFFCQNNQWAISEPLEKQTRVPLHHRADGFGFPGVRVDGNDVLAVMAVMQDAVRRARAGEGPTFVEAFTFRMGPHTTSDDPTRYRVDADVEVWRHRDPIARLKVYLAHTGDADSTFFAEVDAEAEALGERLRTATRALPDPDPEMWLRNIYSEPHPYVEADVAEVLAWRHAEVES
jgi:pyruvate dehydrogenase E1 component alpha subunit